MDQGVLRRPSRDVARLVPKEPFGADVRALSPFALDQHSVEQSDLICAGLEELSRHLRRLEEDFMLQRFGRVEARCRSVVRLADQLGLGRLEQVAADVVYCLDGPDEIALSATFARLIRLMEQALDHAAGQLTAF
ncbi:MAG: hypothetical protein AAGL89_11440 [Pseudomonadota bacterium]